MAKRSNDPRYLQATVDGLNFVSLSIDTFCNGHELSTATSFGYNFDGEIYLVTNWHVLSGRNPFTGQTIDKEGGEPDKLVAYLPNKGDSIMHWKPVEIDLKKNGTPCWVQHPKGQTYDVAAVKIKVPEALEIHALNSQHFVSEMLITVGQDVFVVGYPFGRIIDGAGVPIWKRASIASEMDIDINGQPKFFIDTATRSGMSGSPVYARSVGAFVTKSGAMAMEDTVATNMFLGIYSGRTDGFEEKAQLGIVWKPEVIEEMLKSSVPGDFVIS